MDFTEGEDLQYERMMKQIPYSTHGKVKDRREHNAEDYSDEYERITENISENEHQRPLGE